MTAPDLLALADECERLTGPSMALNMRIATATETVCLNYTRLVDDALTLLPKGFGIGLSGPHVGGWMCGLEPSRWGKNDENAQFYASPALAICAAALRARAALASKGGQS